MPERFFSDFPASFQSGTDKDTKSLDELEKDFDQIAKSFAKVYMSDAAI
jgi:hypothetical protein